MDDNIYWHISKDKGAISCRRLSRRPQQVNRCFWAPGLEIRALYLKPEAEPGPPYAYSLRKQDRPAMGTISEYRVGDRRFYWSWKSLEDRYEL